MDYQFSTLPEEVRGKIFNHLPQIDALRVRQVSRKWRHEIDSRYTFSIHLDERNPSLPRLLQLCIKSCKVHHFLGQHPPTTSVFQSPNLIRFLSFETNEISPANFHNLLRYCAKCLEKLEIKSVGFRLLTFPLSEDDRFDFENLTHLTVSPGHISITDYPTFQSGNFFDHIDTPQLKSLTVQTSFAQLSNEDSGADVKLAYGVTISVLSLIVKQWDTLENIDIKILEAVHQKWPDLTQFNLPLSIDLKLYDKVSSLKKVELNCDLVINLWVKLLTNQNNLRSIHLNFTPATDQIRILYEQIILQNSETLVEVNITDWTNEDEPLDMSVFASCHRLKTLRLIRYNLTDGNTTNFSQLPKSLEVLFIRCFLVLSVELDSYFNSDLPKLRMIDLGCGAHVDFGINMTILLTIFHLPSITYVSVQESDPDDPDERQRLIWIVNAIGIDATKPFGFPVKRESLADPWRCVPVEYF